MTKFVNVCAFCGGVAAACMCASPLFVPIVSDPQDPERFKPTGGFVEIKDTADLPIPFTPPNPALAEMFEHISNQIMTDIAEGRLHDLIYGMHQTQEKAAAEVFNISFGDILKDAKPVGDGVALNSISHPLPPRTKPSPAIFDYDSIREKRAVMFEGKPSGKVYGPNGLEHDFHPGNDLCTRCLMSAWMREDGHGPIACPGKPFGEKCITCGKNAVHDLDGVLACWACGNDSTHEAARHATRRDARAHGARRTFGIVPKRPPAPSAPFSTDDRLTLKTRLTVGDDFTVYGSRGK